MNNISVSKNIMLHKSILKIAVPSVLSNITVPLLSFVDIAIVGHFGGASYVAAIAVATAITNTIYWAFGFLRMGTTGITSQAYGKNSKRGIKASLLKSLVISLVIGLLLLVLGKFLFNVLLTIMHTNESVHGLAEEYFNICIWGAVPTLMLYSLNGWFIGMQNSKSPMYVAISQNIINIVLSLFFVYVLKAGISGVALGTVISQFCAVAMSVLILKKSYGEYIKQLLLTPIGRVSEWKEFFSVNTSIFFRTLCLISVSLFFISYGSSKGEVVLAANTLLMQFFVIFSYFIDGFAFAAEAIVGKNIGAKDKEGVKNSVKALFTWGGALSLLFTVTYIIGNEFIINILTNDKETIHMAWTFSTWACVIPVISFSAFLWDGIFIGATATFQMFISMFIATTVFFVTYNLLYTAYGNQSLWFAFILYLFSRGVVQTLQWKYVIFRKTNIH